MDQRMRANAVVYVSYLVLDGQIQADDFDPKIMCNSMAKLLTDQVRTLVFHFIYKTFVDGNKNI